MSNRSLSSTMELLPDYSSSSAVPVYAENPSPSEQRLDYAPSNHRVLPTSSWSKMQKGVTITLHAQEESVLMPTYGRNGIIRGGLTFKDSEAFCDVTLYVEGRTDVAIVEGGTSNRSLFCHAHSLWTRSESATSCPNVLSFRFLFPSTMMDGERLRPLPPSYTCIFPGIPGLYVKCFYFLTIVIKSKWKVGAWTTRKKISIPLHYYPRTCPSLPIPRNMLPFLSSIKALPEEWTQVVSTMSTRNSSHLEPAECHLFIPRVQTFAVTDAIPFFLQLRAPIATLKAFSPYASSKRSSASIQVHPIPLHVPKAKPVVRVFLYRQVRAEINGQRAWRTIVLGEGQLCALAHTEAFLSSSVSLNDTLESLDWEGEIRCKEDVTVGGFSVGKLVVKDFIVLGLTPPDPQRSPLLQHQHAHSIRLVTDQYVDTIMPARL